MTTERPERIDMLLALAVTYPNLAESGGSAWHDTDTAYLPPKDIAELTALGYLSDGGVTIPGQQRAASAIARWTS